MKLKSKQLLGGALLGLSTAMVTPAYAANDTIKNLLTIMHENGQITDEQFQILMDGTAEDTTSSVDTEAAITKAVDEKMKDLPKVTMKGKFKVE